MSAALRTPLTHEAAVENEPKIHCNEQKTHLTDRLPTELHEKERPSRAPRGFIAQMAAGNTNVGFTPKSRATGTAQPRARRRGSLFGGCSAGDRIVPSPASKLLQVLEKALRLEGNVLQ